jgi:hypothetical protein
MNQSAVLTLGGVLLLGGATVAQADGSSPMTVAPATYGILPDLPENWSDLPLRLNLSEATGYNSNILNSPSTTGGAVTALGRPIGSLVSISNVGGATKAYWEGQQFFADFNIGMYRYLADQAQNTLQHSAHVGDNWTYGSKCNGKLVGSESTYQSQPGQQVGFNVKNTVTSEAFDENATCLVSGNYSILLNSGVSSTANSAAVDKVNDYHSQYIAAGITYSVSQTNSIQLITTVTGLDYSSRTATINSMGLANNITEDQINLTYTKNLSPRLALTASAGLVGVRNASFTLEPASGFEPVYSFSATWAATPKLSLLASASKTVSPPTSVIANLQVSENASLGLTYGLTPKVVLAGGVQVGRSSGGFNTVPPSVSPITAVVQPFTGNSNYYSANASVNYTITPFVTANLSYTYSRTVQANFVTPTSVVLLALTFSPY